MLKCCVGVFSKLLILSVIFSTCSPGFESFHKVFVKNCWLLMNSLCCDYEANVIQLGDKVADIF